MTTAIKRRRGTTAQHSTFTGLEGELTVDTTKDTVVVHDGVTPGGFPLAKESGSAISATNLAYTGTLTGGTGVINIGSGQLYKDASGNVGIGTSAPANKLDVIVDAGAGIRVSSVSGQSNIFLAQAGTTNGYINASGGGGTDLNVYANRNLQLRGTDAVIFFAAQTTERMRIDSAGNVGIGTSAPGDKLEIGGAGAGIILASPNGTRYRITVSDAGVLSVAAV